MELSIIVTNHRNPELLRNCLNSIKKNYYSLDYELIVSDSETNEEMETFMKNEFPDVKYLPHKENIFYQKAIRYGYEVSQGNFFLIMNGDIVVKEGSIEKMMQYLKDHPEAGLISPQLLNMDGTLQYSCYRFPRLRTIVYRRTPVGKLWFAKRHVEKFIMKDFDHKSTRRVDWIMGSVMMTSRDRIDKVGLMDKRFLFYFEDTDWCRRFWENGLEVVYFPIAQMYHNHSRGSVGKGIIRSILFNKLTRIHIYSAIKYFWKYADRPLPKHGD